MGLSYFASLILNKIIEFMKFFLISKTKIHTFSHKKNVTSFPLKGHIESNNPNGMS